MTRIWSAQQQAIFAWFAKAVGNLVVRARAGTGKSTTLLEGVNQVPGDQHVLVAAFSKRIQVELAAKVTNPNVEVLTLHALGARTVRRYWEKIGVDTRGKRADDLAEKVCGVSAPDAIKRLVSKLGTKARELAPLATCGADLVDIAQQFDCVPDDEWKVDGFTEAWVCERAYRTLDLAATTKPTATGIDYADMLFLPIRNKWLRPIYDGVVVDEAQDMTLVQLLLAQGVCKGWFAVVGDDRQAIFAFRGADSGSLDRLKAELQATELGLTTTYRCGRAIVDAAKVIVPDYEAGPNNPEGEITTATEAQLFERVRPGDFILSRTNAPLVSIALGLVRRGKRAKIEGRDIGAGLRSIVNKLATGPAKNSIPQLLKKLDIWKAREVARAEAAKLDHKVEAICDQHETLVALTDGVTGIQELLARLENLFASDVADAPEQIVCSSVHRSKGLEADQVWVLEKTLHPPVSCEKCRRRPKGCKCPDGYTPDPLAEREESNIKYVAITRAKSSLVWVN